MDVHFDIWSGEPIQDIIQILAEFRFQVFAGTNKIQRSLSDEINFLQHYIDTEACIIVANDCGSLVGYIALVGYSDHHQTLSEYAHYGEDLNVSEGPIIHHDYRNMGIAKGLIQEALDACEIKDLALLIIDPTNIMSDNDHLAINKIAGQFNFKSENNRIYKKEFFIE